MQRLWVGLVLALGTIATVHAEEPDYKATMELIQKRHTAAADQFHATLASAKTEADSKASIDAYYRSIDQNAGEVLALCRANPKDPGNVETLCFVIKIARAGPSDYSKQALEILVRDHVRDPGISKTLGWTFFLFHLPVAEHLMREVMTNHPTRQERGWAMSCLGSCLEYQAKMVRRFRDKVDVLEEFELPRRLLIEQFIRDKRDPEALESEAASIYEQTIRYYGDIPEFDGAKRTMAQADGGKLFALRSLGIAKKAPTIEGQEVDGKPLKLTDFCGKIVVLTFSGNWCGPCVGMYPEERAMVESMKDRPFALLSVNTDEKADTLKKAISEGEITWKCWFDSGTEGPITTAWGVTSFPSIFLLDEDGIIRHKNLRGKDLEKAVEELVIGLEAKLKKSSPATDRP